MKRVKDLIGEHLGTPQRKAIAAVVLMALIALALTGAIFALKQPAETPPTPQVAAEPVQEEEEPEVVPDTVTFDVTREGFDPSTSTPLIAHITGTDENEDPVDFYEVIKDETALTLDADTYEASFISPTNADGSIYDVPETLVLKPAHEAVKLELTRIEADKVDDETKAELLDELAIALTELTETLDETETADIMAKAVVNLNPEVAEEAVEESATPEVAKEPAAETNPVEDVAAAPEPQTSAQQSTPAPTKPAAQNPAPAKPAPKPKAPAAPTPTPPAPAKQEPAPAPKPKVPIYETIEHPAVTEQVWVVDVPAKTEKVRVGSKWVTSDGKTFYSVEDLMAYTKPKALEGISISNSVHGIYETVTTPEQGHYETKVIKPAWTEKKIVGYK